jgi:hypothetical protein
MTRASRIAARPTRIPVVETFAGGVGDPLVEDPVVEVGRSHIDVTGTGGDRFDERDWRAVVGAQPAADRGADGDEGDQRGRQGWQAPP